MALYGSVAMKLLHLIVYQCLAWTLETSFLPLPFLLINFKLMLVISIVHTDGIVSNKCLVYVSRCISLAVQVGAQIMFFSLIVGLYGGISEVLLFFCIQFFNVPKD